MEVRGHKARIFCRLSLLFRTCERIRLCSNSRNPVICVPPIPASELLITQDTNWNAVRLGFNGEWRWGGWIVDSDLAWIPYAWLNANDTHWQRIPFDFSGPTPELGNSFNNVQIEALLRYQFQNGFSVGIGGRYWRIDTTSAQAHFKSRLLGAEFHRPSHS